jgi:hypothetical protein
MKQILHIFRKDCRQFWPQLLTVLVIFALHAYGQMSTLPAEGLAIGVNASSIRGILFVLSSLSAALLPLGMALLTAGVIQDEALVGTEQFWLTRPYDRRCLLVEKVLCVVAFLILPMLVHDLFLLVRFNFPISSAFAALLVKIAELCVLLLIMVAIAALTASFARFTLVTVVMATVVSILLLDYGDPFLFGWSWLGDVRWVSSFAVASLGAIAVICWQYATRRTTIGVIAGLLFLTGAILILRFWPWSVTWNLYSLLIPADSQLQAVHVTASVNLADVSLRELPLSDRRSRTILYPLRISGLPEDVEVVGFRLDGELELPREKSIRLFGQPTRFQADRPVELNTFIYPSSENQLVPLLMVSEETFQRVKDLDSTITGSMYFEAYRLTQTRLVIPKDSISVQSGKKTCTVRTMLFQGTLRIFLDCTELGPASGTLMGVRLVDSQQTWKETRRLGERDTAGLLSPLFTPIRKTREVFEFRPPLLNAAGQPQEIDRNWPASEDLLILTERPAGLVRRDFRIERFRLGENDAQSWERRGIIRIGLAPSVR